MSSQEEIVRRQKIFQETITRWMAVEQETIGNADRLIAVSSSTLVKQIMLLIKRDSEKHAELLMTIRDIMEGTTTMTPEELGEISQLLEHHVAIENESIILANAALEHTDHFVVRQLLNYILEDERKHLRMTEQVEEYKRKIY